MGDRISVAIANLASEPRAGTQKLTGYDLWRIRVGDYRVIYSIDDEQKLVVIVRVAKRAEAYRGL